MYYYILDLGNKNIAKIKEKLEVMMASYGISGDFGKISPLCSAYELAKRARAEGYSTVVAIGNTEIINQVTQGLVNSDTTMGIIPIDTDSTIYDLIGVEALKDALETLRTRKIETIDIGKVSENKYFLTEAKILNSRPIPTVLDFTNFKIGGNFKEIIIANGSGSKKSYEDGLFDIKIFHQEKNKSIWQIFKAKDEKEFSLLHQENLKIETEQQCEVLIDHEVVTKTPCQISILPLALKLIIARSH
ncbi:MAG: diacylglycerol kinase family protein [Candidatus Berkelbacteria bacterium]|nr:diacylglycerol kinase family protein [Candidatus Berkelbacteria bacterium]